MHGPSSCPLASTDCASSRPNSSTHRLESLPSVAQDNSRSPTVGDEALAILSRTDGARHYVTEAENQRVLRKIDLYLMPILIGVYFLQFMDKQTLAFASVFGIADDTHLVRNQYSLLGSIVYVAQLFFQPLSAYFLVRFRLSLYLPFVVTCWGATLACMAAASNFNGLLISRFFLGGLESSIMPAFVLIGQIWYRRREQGLRIALWYANNGWGNIFGSLIMFGLGHIRSNTLHSYQIIFLLLGSITVLVGITCFFVFPDNPVKSKFLNPEDKLIAVERLRANQQGLETKQFKFSQAMEMLLDVKSWCWMLAMFFVSVPGGGVTIFGPFILQGFGYNGYDVMLLSIPFGFLQVASIYASTWASQKYKMKSPAILTLLIPCIVGTAILRGCGRTPQDQPALLVAYYLLSCHTAITPLILNWHSTNVAGHTKKTTTTALTTMGFVGGNIAGPLLFAPSEAPSYSKGLSASLASFSACAAMVCVTTAYLAYLNKWNERRRVAAGKPAKLVDYSMLTIEEAEQTRAKEAERSDHTKTSIGNNAFDDLTDLQNDEFIYVY